MPCSKEWLNEIGILVPELIFGEADLIVAVIIYLCAFVTLFKGIVANLFKSKKEQKANANADNGKEEKK